MSPRISLFQKLYSYFSDISITKVAGEYTVHLELILRSGRLILATPEALYSDGDNYPPAILLVKNIKNILPQIKSALILGGGMGSLIDVFKRNGVHPDVTIVEYDKVILGLLADYTLSRYEGKARTYYDDVRTFMSHNTEKYDLVFIDIFMGRIVPDFVVQPVFLNSCKMALQNKGTMCLNYIINDELQWLEDKEVILGVLNNANIVSFGTNRLFIKLF